MKGLSVLAIITACSLSLSFLAKAQPASAVPEIEPNDSFTSKQVLPLGTSTVDGELSSTSLGGCRICWLNYRRIPWVRPWKPG